MKTIIYRRSILALFAVCLVLSLFAVGASAASIMRPGYNRNADIAEDTADENGMVGDDNTSAPGTGEFGDDTSNTMNDTSDTSKDTSKNDTSDTRDSVGNRVENAVSDVVDGAEDAVDDMTGGMSVWSIVLIIAIIAAIVVLVLAFFTRRK